MQLCFVKNAKLNNKGILRRRSFKSEQIFNANQKLFRRSKIKLPITRIAASGVDGSTIGSYALLIFSSGLTQQQSTLLINFIKIFLINSGYGRTNKKSHTCGKPWPFEAIALDNTSPPKLKVDKEPYDISFNTNCFQNELKEFNPFQANNTVENDCL